MLYEVITILDFVTGGGHRIQADVREEDRAGRRADTGDTEGCELSETVSVESRCGVV